MYIAYFSEYRHELKGSLMIARQLHDPIQQRLTGKRAVIVYGARQVGKTTLINQILTNRNNVLRMNGDSPDVRMLLHEVTATRWRQILGHHATLFLDEAQRIDNIGLKLKLLTDELPDIALIVSGSSSFELAGRITEPLTGRKWEFRLDSLSFQELIDHHGLLEERRSLLQRLVFGAYPEVVTTPGDESGLLQELASSYLYKDILNSGQVKKVEKLETLVQALAWQVGSQVSYNELAQLCGLDSKTVEKYINILEAAFVVFRLPSFSRNLRNELKFSRKIYFCDNGIRNAVIGSFIPAEARADVGQLWENYLISERLKQNRIARPLARSYFWRSSQQQEIDYIEECDGQLAAWEFKWNARAKHHSPRTFLNTYSLKDVPVIHPQNYEDFLLT
jgi:predicted AAA+ superfamily ATPase